MLCNECKTKIATMHYVTIINGVKNERDLCSECAQKLGATSYAPFTWGDLFSYVAPPAPRVACSRCGMSLHELKEKGVVGCEKCYAELRAGIEPVLRRVQKSLTHVGRSPANNAARKLPKPGETRIAPQEQSEMEKLQIDLQIELQNAINAEQFEQAAILRDRLKSLKESEENRESEQHSVHNSTLGEDEL